MLGLRLMAKKGLDAYGTSKMNHSNLKSIKRHNTIVNIRGWCLAIIATVSSLAMMHGDSNLVSDGIRRLIAIPNYLSTLIIIVTVIYDNKSFKIYAPLTICVFVTWFITSFNAYREIDYAPLSLIILILFSGLGDEVWSNALGKYRYFLLITSLYGILAYASFVFSLGLPYVMLDFYGNHGTINDSYINYYLSLLTLSPEGLRLCGLFNEPGYFGTVIALYLISQKVNLRNWGNVVMFIAGCLSFSMAYFALLILYVLFILIKNPKYIFAIVATVVVFSILLPILAKHNEMFGVLAERFTIEDGQMVGNNRTTDAFDANWSHMFDEGKVLFGYGSGYMAEIQVHSLSYKQVILEHGFMGAFIMWGLLFFAAINKAKKNYYAKLLVILFLISIYQRPGIFQSNYLLVLFGGISFLNRYSISSEKKKPAPKLTNVKC